MQKVHETLFGAAYLYDLRFANVGHRALRSRIIHLSLSLFRAAAAAAEGRAKNGHVRKGALHFHPHLQSARAGREAIAQSFPRCTLARMGKNTHASAFPAT